MLTYKVFNDVAFIQYNGSCTSSSYLTTHNDQSSACIAITLQQDTRDSNTFHIFFKMINLRDHGQTSACLCLVVLGLVCRLALALEKVFSVILVKQIKC